MNTMLWAKLLKSSALLIVISALLVVFSYYYIDKAVVLWVSEHHLRDNRLIEFFTRIPNLFFLNGFMVVIVLYCLAGVYGKQSPILEIAFRIGMILCASITLKDQLKSVFGRPWADTWICQNPSFLKNHLYGFFPFHSDVAYSSFPSGHTCATVLVSTLIALLWPKFKWPAVFLSALVGISLVLMWYHYVSDVIAGACLGYLFAQFGFYLTRLDTLAVKR